MVEIKDIKYLVEYQKYKLENMPYIYAEHESQGSKITEYCAYNASKLTGKYNSPVAFDALKMWEMNSYYELTIEVLKEYTKFKIKGDKDIDRIINYIKENLKNEEERLKQEKRVDYENIFQICTYSELILSNTLQSIIQGEKGVKLCTYTLDYEELLENVQKKNEIYENEVAKHKDNIREMMKNTANRILDNTENMEILKDIYPINIPITLLQILRSVRDGKKNNKTYFTNPDECLDFLDEYEEFDEYSDEKDQNDKETKLAATMIPEINENPYQDKQHVKALYFKEMLDVTRIRNRKNSDLLN